MGKIVKKDEPRSMLKLGISDYDKNNKIGEGMKIEYDNGRIYCQLITEDGYDGLEDYADGRIIVPQKGEEYAIYNGLTRDDIGYIDSCLSDYFNLSDLLEAVAAHKVHFPETDIKATCEELIRECGKCMWSQILRTIADNFDEKRALSKYNKEVTGALKNRIASLEWEIENKTTELNRLKKKLDKEEKDEKNG
jgi:hypothetical protein